MTLNKPNQPKKKKSEADYMQKKDVKSGPLKTVRYRLPKCSESNLTEKY